MNCALALLSKHMIRNLNIKAPALLVTVLALPLLGLNVQADTLLIDRARAQSQQTAQELPGRGLSMQQVEAQFGAPYEVHPAIGEPPITRWVYPDFVVYFEHQYVIHSVLKHKQP